MRKIIYLLTHAGRCGGVRVIAEHVTRLAARGHDASVWHVGGDWGWFEKPVPSRNFAHTDDLGAALQAIHGKVVVATWWQTAFWVNPNLHRGDKGFYLVQDIDQKVYSGDDSGTSYKQGLSHLTESEFISKELSDLYGVQNVNVGIGIDHDKFRPIPFERDRNRVLCCYRPYQAHLKGWDVARSALFLLASLRPQTTLVTFGDSQPPDINFMPTIHLGPVSDRKLRELYSQSGVFLSTSRREGFGLPMVEAAACGCPVVSTDCGGNREFADGIVIADNDKLAETIIGIMDNPLVADRMTIKGRLMANRYRWDKVIDRLEAIYGQECPGI